MFLDGIHHFNRFGKERIQLLFDRLAKELEDSELYDNTGFENKYNNKDA